MKIDREHLKPLPVGKSDWAESSQRNYTVDKTLLIKDLLDDDTAVALFTRPRRFGKTTAMRMPKAFFEKTPKDTSFLFKPFKIWSAGEQYRAEQGKYPVIYLTFKDHKGRSWEDAVNWMRETLASEVGRHACVLDDEWKVEANRELLKRILAKEASVADMAVSLGVLGRSQGHPLGRQPMKEYMCEVVPVYVCPRPIVEEKACVGVIVRCPEARVADWRLVDQDAGAIERIANFFPRFGRDNLKRALVWARQDIEHSLAEDGVDEVERRFANLIRPRENVIQYGAPWICTTATPNEEVERAYRTLI